jgi:hypothetical protein
MQIRQLSIMEVYIASQPKSGHAVAPTLLLAKVRQRNTLTLVAGSSPGLHIVLRDVTCRNQGVHARSGQFGSVIPKAVIQKWASYPIFAAEIVIIPSTVL